MGNIALRTVHLIPQTKTWKHPLKKIKSLVFMSAAQAPDLDGYLPKLTDILKMSSIAVLCILLLLGSPCTPYIHCRYSRPSLIRTPVANSD